MIDDESAAVDTEEMEMEPVDAEPVDTDTMAADIESEFPEMDMEMTEELTEIDSQPETFFDDEMEEESLIDEFNDMSFETPEEPETFFDDEIEEESMVDEIDDMSLEIPEEPETFFDDEMEEFTLDAPTTEDEMLDLPDDVGVADDMDVTLEFPGQEVSEAALSLEEDTITVEFPDEEVRTIISNVADLFELNVVIPDTLVGSTTLKLRNVSWQQVFDVVLEPLGYTWVRDRNIIKIKSQEDLLQEPVETRVFIINFASAGEMQGSISPLVDSAAGGRIQVDSRSNSLVITERPSKFNNIQAIIDRLDRPNAQVMIESKFVEVADRDERNQGINWSSLSGYGISAGPFNRSYNKDTTQTRGDTAGDSLNSSVADSNDFTRTNTDGVVTSTDTSATNVATTNIIDQTLNLVNSAVQGRLDTAVFSADSFNVVLSFLSEFSDTELISNPTVVTVNNTPALIAIGDRFPIPEYSYNDERGTFEVSGFEYLDIGINLKVTPQVNSAGFISLDIQPEVSSEKEKISFGGAGGALIPVITSRRTESTITIKDGFTLAIGGLIEKTVANSSNKVPVIGEIPIVGRLFRSRGDVESKRNLIIFITARTLNPDGSTYEDIFSPRVLSDMGITPSEVPGYEVSDTEAQLHADIRAAKKAANRMIIEAELQHKIDKLTPKPKSGKKQRKAEQGTYDMDAVAPPVEKKQKGFHIFGKKRDEQTEG